jgi:hypothetical protein
MPTYKTYLNSILNGRPTYMLDADKGGGGGGGNPDDDDKGGGNKTQTGGEPDDKLNLDELMKDPEFKKQYEAKIKDQLDKRLKKYEGVDLEKYKQLTAKEQEELDKDLSDSQKLQKQLDTLKAEKLAFESKERTYAIKDFVYDSGLNPKIAKLVQSLHGDSVKRGEDGEWSGIEEAVQSVKADFPELFPSDEEDEDSTPEDKGNRRTFKTPNQSGNKQTPKDLKALGKSKAAERHGKKD